MRIRKNRPYGASSKWERLADAGPGPINVYWDAAFLSRCSEREACAWLENRPVNYNSLTGVPETPPESHVLEYILYRRDSPLVDLILARYGRSRSVLERVFRRSTLSIRAVACGNPSLFYGEKVRFTTSAPEIFLPIVTHGSLAELRAICENLHMFSNFYAYLAECWEGWGHTQFNPDTQVSDDRFKRILFFLSQNPRISTPFEESKQRGFGYEFPVVREYEELHQKCWELAKVIPVEREWAYILSELYRNLWDGHYNFDHIEAVLDRWRPANESFYEFETSPFERIREEIAAKFLTPKIEMLNSDDPAMRKAFYRTFDPERPYYETDRIEWREMDWTEWLARDEYCHLWLESNQKIWQSPLGRRKLENLLWHASRRDHSDLDFFREREEEYRKTNPEWFENEEEKEEYHEPEPDRLGNLERAIENLGAAFGQRRATDAIWFLVAALIGSFVGAAIW